MSHRILAVDLSSSTGWAVMTGKDHLLGCGLLLMDKPETFGISYPNSFVMAAHKHATNILQLAYEQKATKIILEETNPGREVYSQKILEYSHCMLAELNQGAIPIVYIRTGEWRKRVGLRLSKEQAKGNLSKNLKKAKTEAAVLRKKIKSLGSGKAYAELRGRLKGELAGLQISRVTQKNLAVNMVNELYGKEFLVKDNDIADAILVGRAFFLGAEICDGKRPSGTKKTSKKTE